MSPAALVTRSRDPLGTSTLMTTVPGRRMRRNPDRGVETRSTPSTHRTVVPAAASTSAARPWSIGRTSTVVVSRSEPTTRTVPVSRSIVASTGVGVA